ncbi:putative [Trichovirus mali]|uniref:Putative movement protein n=1 Tax=Apple chlorotic leaf spot virus (isolate plum P863) TaxID=73473 RepID=MP_ACLSP|nr:movement protein [Apple chlorotic leaf spot virus]P27739.1 RecName: Full=Putative movement protein; AltName: Full=50.8 kDa protein; AltName: Full=ORF2 protein [Apple chlorotic leaf spot virus (isolate PLUM P863)]AAA42588.1 putative [Apple chlorotic leaf spot virus]
MATMIRGHRLRIAEGDIPIAGVKSSRIYSDISPFKKASDLMIHWNEFVFKVMPEDIAGDGFRLASIPVIPSSEVQAVLRKRESTNYVHWGALSISIDALFRKNAGVSGWCYVYDNRWETFEQAMLQKFHFNLDSGSATLVTSPNFPVSLDDPGLSNSISVAVMFENLNFKFESYPISVRVGNMCRFFDSFLSSVKNKVDSNFLLEASNADPLGVGAFGFEQDDQVSELFNYIQTVPTQAIKFREHEIPKGFLGMMGKKKIKSFEFASGSKGMERRKPNRGKQIDRSFSQRAVPGFRSQNEKVEHQGLSTDSDFENFLRNKRGNKAGVKSTASEGSSVDNISSREFQFARQNQAKEDGSSSEFAAQGGRKSKGISGRRKQTSSWKDRGNPGTDTGVHLREHSDPGNVRADGVSGPSGGSEINGGSISPRVLQPEGSGQLDQSFQDYLFGPEHQQNDIPSGL